MSGGTKSEFGTASFPSLLLRAGLRIKRLYLTSMTTWTGVYGLPLLTGFLTARLLDRAAATDVGRLTWVLLGGTVALMLLRAVLVWAGLQFTFALIFRTATWLKIEVLGRLMGRSAASGPPHSGGEMLNRLRDDTDEIGGLLEWTTDLVYRSALVVIAVTVLLATDPVMASPLLLLLGGFAASIFLKSRVAALQGDIRGHQGRIGASILDTVTGIRDLRLAGALDGRLGAFDRQFEQRRVVQLRHQVYADLLSDLFRNLVAIGTGVVLLTAGMRIAGGDFAIGTLVLFLTYASWLGQQMYFFGKILARYQSGRVAYQRLSELAPADEPGPRSGATEELSELSVRGLTCAPRHGAAAPPPVDFDVRPGELVVLTGEIGSGKSTILRSLVALQPGVLGTVRWNGADVTGDGAWFRSPRVAYARQSARFLRGTVRENLVLGSPDIPDKQIEEVLTAVHLRPGSAELPGGLDTHLESGAASSLSGGQRQRLALARMLCRPAQVYVVDDCDSSLDAATAKAIWSTVPRQWGGAWIVVSHNPHLLAAADRIVVLRRPGSDDVAPDAGRGCGVAEPAASHA